MCAMDFLAIDVYAGFRFDGRLKCGSELRDTVAKSNDSLSSSRGGEGNSGRATR